MLNRVVHPARRTNSARRANRSRRLLLESLEARQMMAVTALSVTSPAAVDEGQPLVLTLNFTDPASTGGSYTALVDWGDGTARESIPLTTTGVGPLLAAQVSRTYGDDNVGPIDTRNITVAVFNNADPVASYWQFNSVTAGVTPDSLGTNNGTLGSGVSLVAGPVGSGALAFNGSGTATINVGQTATANTGLAIEALVRPTGVAAGANFEIMRKEDGGNRYLFSFQTGSILSFGTNINGGYSELDFQLDTTTRVTGVFLDAPAPGVAQPGDVILKDGNYHHLVATYDEATGRRSIYIDGVERFFDTRAAGSQIAPIVGGVPAYIGSSSGSSEFFNGVMDEVAFYARAITPGEITDHYNRFLAGESYFFESVTVTVNNVAPVFDLGPDTAIDEGDTYTVIGNFTDVAADIATATATVDYGDGSGVQPLALTGNAFTLNHVYANQGSFLVTVSISDGDGGITNDTLTVIVANVLPSLVAASTVPVSILEGSSTNLTIDFADPGVNDVHTATIDWGDGNITAGTVDQVTNRVTGSHVYANEGSYTISYSINDGTGTFNASFGTPVTVANVLPTVGAITGTSTVAEGSNASISVGFTDPGTLDVHTALINWGDGNITAGVVDQVTNTVTGTHTYVNNNAAPYQVTVIVNDGVGNSAPSAAFPITVTNVQPTIDAGAVINGDEGSTVTLAATFVDPGLADTHTATIDWGDGSPVVSGTVNEILRTISGGHIYDNDGTYTVIVTVTDGESAVVSDTTTAVIADVPPTVIITGPATAVRGAPTTFIFDIDDPSPVDLAADYEYTIDWGDGSPVQTLTGPSFGFEVIHTFATASPPGADFTITVFATDIDGNSGPDTTQDIAVTIFEVVPNPDTGADDLVIGGTPLADRIVVSALYSGGLQVRINNDFYRNLPDFNGKVIIHGGDGGDTIQIAGGLPYDFELYGDNGNDYISGGLFNDILNGGAGNDRLLDSRGDNTFIGGAGNDQISGGNGIDYAFGGEGNDRIIGSGGEDVLDGEAGNDTIDGGFGDDIMFGGAGNDTMTGYVGNDVMDGGAGNDRLTGSSGRDVMIGGLGSDQFYGGIDDDLIVHASIDLGNGDDREFDIASLVAIREDWMLPLALLDRIDILSVDSGSRVGLNSSTIADDLARESIFGDGDEDWFLVANLLEIRRLFAGDEYTIV